MDRTAKTVIKLLREKVVISPSINKKLTIGGLLYVYKLDFNTTVRIFPVRQTTRINKFMDHSIFYLGASTISHPLTLGLGEADILST
jgi:hypothetical protein